MFILLVMTLIGTHLFSYYVKVLPVKVLPTEQLNTFNGSFKFFAETYSDHVNIVQALQSFHYLRAVSRSRNCFAILLKYLSYLLNPK